MKNTAEYRVSVKCTDDLANSNAEIGVRVFDIDVVNNIIKKSSIQLENKDFCFQRMRQFEIGNRSGKNEQPKH
jgi:hypothetical protein